MIELVKIVDNGLVTKSSILVSDIPYKNPTAPITGSLPQVKIQFSLTIGFSLGFGVLAVLGFWRFWCFGFRSSIETFGVGNF